MTIQQRVFDVDVQLSDRLDAASAKFDTIIDDHILLIMVEMDGFIDGPIYGALIFLRRAIAGPMGGDGEERGPSAIGDYENATHKTLQERLSVLAEFLDSDCPVYDTRAQRSSSQGLAEWTGRQIGLAIVSLNIAVERLRADAVATGHGEADPSVHTLTELMAESRNDAMAQHGTNRQKLRDAGTIGTQ